MKTELTFAEVFSLRESADFAFTEEARNVGHAQEEVCC